MKPLVSILIPAYNAQDWIAYTLQSAIAQTWERKEIIVVDDGSTDQTLAAARRFESETVRVVSQKNQGAAAARNKAFSLCQGDYIQWLDADDLLSPDKISSQMALLESCPSRRTLVSSAWGRFMYRPDRAEFVPTSLWVDGLTPTEWLIHKLAENIFMQTSTWLVSRELTEAAGPWDTRLLGDDDGEYFCRVLLQCDSIRFVPKARVYYRLPGSGSLSHIGLSNRKIEAQWLSMQIHIGFLRSLEDSPRVRDACVKYLQNWLFFFYPQRPDIVSQAEKLAGELDGRLETPRLSWKYSWIRAAFGWDMAQRARFFLPSVKWSVLRSLDKALFLLQDPKLQLKL